MSVELTQQSVYNQAYIQRAKDSGRRPVRGMLSDKETSELYEVLIQDVPKKKIGNLLSVMVKLAATARENGQLIIDEEGNVSLNSGTLEIKP